MMNLTVSVLRKLFGYIGWLYHFFYSTKIAYVIYLCKREFITKLKKHIFSEFGHNSLIGLNVRFINPQFMKLGTNSSICSNSEVSCHKISSKKGELPEMIIGDSVSIGENNHITCANKLHIGNAVLTGKYVLITDNAHGLSTKKMMSLRPMERPVTSNGPVIIEDNVWIGEKASIMPNVRIGKGAIIAANAVVTMDVPAYSVVAGIPAKVVKQL